MTIEEKRLALIEIAQENISYLYGELTQAAQDLKISSKQKELLISHFSNYDIEVSTGKTVDYINSINEAIAKATKTLNDYKYGADDHIKIEYELYKKNY